MSSLKRTKSFTSCRRRSFQFNLYHFSNRLPISLCYSKQEVFYPFNSFGRRAVINLRQALASKILELQKEHFYHSFVGRVGELISAEVYQVWKREALLIDDEGNELLMPKTEQIPGDFFRKGETVRAVIERVENENSNPKVILRASALSSSSVSWSSTCPRSPMALSRSVPQPVSLASVLRSP